jgi:hypothetical protein
LIQGSKSEDQKIRESEGWKVRGRTKNEGRWMREEGERAEIRKEDRGADEGRKWEGEKFGG